LNYYKNNACYSKEPNILNEDINNNSIWKRGIFVNNSNTNEQSKDNNIGSISPKKQINNQNDTNSDIYEKGGSYKNNKFFNKNNNFTNDNNYSYSNNKDNIYQPTKNASEEMHESNEKENYHKNSKNNNVYSFDKKDLNKYYRSCSSNENNNENKKAKP